MRLFPAVAALLATLALCTAAHAAGRGAAHAGHYFPSWALFSFAVSAFRTRIG